MIEFIYKYPKRQKGILVSASVFILSLFIFLLNSNVVLAALTDKGECKPMAEYYADNNTCMMCEILNSIFDACGLMVDKVYVAVAPSALSLLAVATGMWLAVFILKAVSSLTPVDPLEMLQKIGNQLFRAIIVAAFLHGSSAMVMDTIISPVMTGIFSFGSALSGGNCQIDPSAGSVGAFPASMKQSMTCLIAGMQSQLAHVIAIGAAVKCIATEYYGIFELSRYSLWIMGVSIYVVLIVLLFCFPFYLIDSMIRLGLSLSMLPLILVAWAFDSTKNFSQKAWDMFLRAAMTFVIMALMIGFVVAMVGYIFGSIPEIEKIINGDDIEELKKVFSFTGIKFIQVIAVGVVGFALIGSCGEFASTICGGGGGWSTGGNASIGASVGAMAASSMKKGATAVAAPVVSVAKSVGKSAGQAAGRQFSAGAKEAGNKIGQVGRKALAGAGFNPVMQKNSNEFQNDQGGTTKTETKTKADGSSVSKMEKTTSNGQTMLTTITKDKDGNSVTVQTDGVFTRRKFVDASGKVSETFAFAQDKHIINPPINADGTFNKSIDVSSTMFSSKMVDQLRARASGSSDSMDSRMVVLKDGGANISNNLMDKAGSVSRGFSDKVERRNTREELFNQFDKEIKDKKELEYKKAEWDEIGTYHDNMKLMKVQKEIEARQKVISDFDKKNGTNTKDNDLIALQKQKVELEKRIEAQEMRHLGHEHYEDFKNSESARARPQLDKEAREKEREKRRNEQERQRKEKERKERAQIEKEQKEKDDKQRRDEYLRKQEDNKKQKDEDAKKKHEQEQKIRRITEEMKAKGYSKNDISSYIENYMGLDDYDETNERDAKYDDL